jgi:hypothetical protein
MLHLLSAAVNPQLPLPHCLEHWPEIARVLCEPKRKRQRQLERLASVLPIE